VLLRVCCGCIERKLNFTVALQRNTAVAARTGRPLVLELDVIDRRSNALLGGTCSEVITPAHKALRCQINPSPSYTREWRRPPGRPHQQVAEPDMF